MNGGLSWDAIGAIGEIVGAAAVVITLAYLAVQIRQNTKASRAATMQNIVALAAAWSLDLAKDAELAGIWGRFLRNEPVPDAEAARGRTVALALIRLYENIHYQHGIGLLDDGQWRALAASLQRIVRTPGFQSWWTANREIVHPELSAYIEAIVGRSSE